MLRERGEVTGHIEVVNWEQYQHYTKRNPPWIKLHNTLLDNYDLMRLEVEYRWCAVGLMLLASRTGNKIPAEYDYLVNRLWLDPLPEMQPLVSVGFISMSQDASAALARCTHDARLSRGETEAEAETDAVATQPSAARVEKSGKAYVAARYLPVIRDQLRPGEKHDRATESRDVSVICQMLEKGADPDEVEDAIRGLAWLRDHGRISWLPKGQPTSMRALYNTKSGVTTVWAQAVHAAVKHIHEKQPKKRDELRPFTVNIDQGAA